MTPKKKEEKTVSKPISQSKGRDIVEGINSSLEALIAALSSHFMSVSTLATMDLFRQFRSAADAPALVLVGPPDPIQRHQPALVLVELPRYLMGWDWTCRVLWIVFD